MHKILQKILEEKYYEIIKRKQKGLYFRPFWDRPPFDLKAYLEKENFTVIAEIKRASPLKGSLRADFNPVKIAEAYIKAGAKAISVITEEYFFYGTLEYLAAVRVLTDLPLLRKDFIFDPIQIEEAKAFGADFVLLIADLLSLEDLRELYGYTKKIGLSALTEVHSQDNLEKALSVGVDVLGINNRNLKTLKLNPRHGYKLLHLIPKKIPVIAESGISTPDEVKALKRAGFRGVLVGTALVKAEKPGLLLNKMVEALDHVN